VSSRFAEDKSASRLESLIEFHGLPYQHKGCKFLNGRDDSWLSDRMLMSRSPFRKPKLIYQPITLHQKTKNMSHKGCVQGAPAWTYKLDSQAITISENSAGNEMRLSLPNETSSARPVILIINPAPSINIGSPARSRGREDLCTVTNIRQDILIFSS